VKALVLGMGFQGRAVIHDLEQSPIIREIWAADMNFDQAQSYVEAKGYAKTKIIELNACQKTKLSKVIHDSGANIIICMLPPDDFIDQLKRRGMRVLCRVEDTK